MYLKMYNNIINKLDNFIINKNVPNIIFYGNSNSGKRTIVYNFIKNIYNNDNELIKKYVFNINCVYNKGIKFIREEIKYFSKTNIDNKYFKSILLLNADKLTIDAQSALRRCIELYSHTTRFFFIVEDKNKILNPILSRLCDVYIKKQKNIIKDNISNVDNSIEYNINKNFSIDNTKNILLLNTLINYKKIKNDKKYLIKIVNKLYNKGYCSLDILEYIKNKNIDNLKKYSILLMFDKVKKNLINEKISMLYLLNLFRSDLDLENINII
jgi:DNA polymerase III delta prime subunit